MFNQFSAQSNEQIKQDVLTNLYLTGRYNQMYFGRTSKSNKNPIKEYINRFLSINNILLDDDANTFCEDCYQTIFLHLAKKPADKIVSILQESPNGSKLIATACFVAKTQCFSKKANPKFSGIVWNMINKSNYGGVEISTSERRDEEDNHDNSIIIYDEPEGDAFETKYGLSIEQILSRLTDDDKEYFYSLINDKQKRGKPTKEVQAKKTHLYDRIRKIKEDLDKEKND